MSGNVFGELFRLAAFGESHGKGIGGVVDGCPPGIVISLDAVERDFTVIDAGHFGTEKIFSDNMMKKLMSALTHKGYNVSSDEGICIKLAESEHSPFAPIL